ncbi:phage tail protein [Bartonella acomydis]|uniref:Phage tail collar domain-containing protein n=1 Tax=Bartonella acomydis TaxID=686234 RepID=A0ABP9MUX6_9HYPH
MSSIYDWSLTASENAYADEGINWAEGQPPSSVNDSARAMMQRIKEYLLDNGGVIEAQFSFDKENNKTAVHLRTKSSFEVYKGGIMLRFRAQEQNSGTTNVALNQLLPRPVYMATPVGITPLSGGEIQKGGLYELVYTPDIAGKNADGWFLTNPTQSFAAGFIGTFAMEKVPPGWLLCDGKAYSRRIYANLFAALGEIWGRGDGRTTFNVPDLRAMFLRGLDYEKNIDKGRRLGSRQEESFKAHTHQGKTDFTGAHTHKIKECEAAGIDVFYGNYKYFFNGSEDLDTTLAGDHEHKVILEKTGGDETRPVNVAVVYAVKA